MCPNCGGALSPPNSEKGVCLSFAGARVLNFDSAAPTPSSLDVHT
ncbi:MAG: hypothetical protein JWM35_1351, partial [Verrucomicrobia bacterium]|nr:hypothetical protein [Verrucomicrobiota bacterium]